MIQDRGGAAGTLVAVAAAGQRDAWAVGSAQSGSSPLRTLAVRWTGARWRIVRTPSPNGQENLLDGVAVVSPRDAWAVGGQGAMSGITASLLIEHWDGARWTVVQAPQNAGQLLSSVAAISARDVWAVGDSNVISFRGSMQTFSLHWDGSAWVAVATPDPGEYNALNGLTRIPGTDRLWAVGSTEASDTRPVKPLIDYWNGSRWIAVRAPAVAGGGLSAVAAIGPRDAWAVGGVYNRSGAPRAPLVLHFNGSRWSRVVVPAGAAAPLSGVGAVSRRDVWAAGGGTILHWTGAAWRTVSWPRPHGGALAAVAVARGRGGWTAWTAGRWRSSTRPLIAARCG